MKFFTEIVAGLKWVGKELVLVPDWINKVVTTTGDVEKDAVTLLPETVLVIQDADALVAAAVKDSGADLSAAEALVASITTAAQADGINILDDEGVVTALKAFVTQVTNTTNYADILAAVKKLVVDFDTLKGDAAAALKKLETDV